MLSTRVLERSPHTLPGNISLSASRNGPAPLVRSASVGVGVTGVRIVWKQVPVCALPPSVAMKMPISKRLSAVVPSVTCSWTIAVSPGKLHCFMMLSTLILLIPVSLALQPTGPVQLVSEIAQGVWLGVMVGVLVGVLVGVRVGVLVGVRVGVLVCARAEAGASSATARPTRMIAATRDVPTAPYRRPFGAFSCRIAISLPRDPACGPLTDLTRPPVCPAGLLPRGPPACCQKVT